jgi:Testicular haploid expressed repeat
MITPNPSLLSLTVTERLESLARHKVLVKGESGFREHPFKVEPNALKARCTPRTKQLAEPKKR